MAFKLTVLFATLACASAGLLNGPVATYSSAPAVSSVYSSIGSPSVLSHSGLALGHQVAISSPAVASAQENTIRSLAGTISQYSKAVDTIHSSDRRLETRISNKGVAVAHGPLLAAPAIASPILAQRTILGQQTLLAQPGLGHQTLLAQPGLGHQTLLAQPGLGHQTLLAQPALGHQTLLAQPALGHQTLLAQPALSHQTLLAQPTLGHQTLLAQPALQHRTLLAQPALGHQTLLAQPALGHQTLLGQQTILGSHGIPALAQRTLLAQPLIGHQNVLAANHGIAAAPLTQHSVINHVSFDGLGAHYAW